MDNFSDLVARRRSHRKYTEEKVSPEHIKLILRAALMSPTSKSQRSWEFVVVEDKEVLEKLSRAKDLGAQFLKEAPLAIVVLGDSDKNDCWVEDSSLAALSMQYQAEDLGLGSCWVHFRGRNLADGSSSDSYVRNLLNVPSKLSVLCAIAIGHPLDERNAQNEDRLKWGNVHYETF